jgi:hypothetical protein
MSWRLEMQLETSFDTWEISFQPPHWLERTPLFPSQWDTWSSDHEFEGPDLLLFRACPNENFDQNFHVFSHGQLDIDDVVVSAQKECDWSKKRFSVLDLLCQLSDFLSVSCDFFDCCAIIATKNFSHQALLRDSDVFSFLLSFLSRVLVVLCYYSLKVSACLIRLVTSVLTVIVELESDFDEWDAFENECCDDDDDDLAELYDVNVN